MRPFLAVILPCLFLLPLTAEGQEWSAEQLEVWQTVEASWVAETEVGISWYDEFVHPDFKGWSMTRPYPMDLDTARRWSRYGRETSKTLIFSLHPMAIVIQGNTAVAFYYVSAGDEDEKGERETTHSREVDTFVRENGKWMILSWMTGDEPSGGS